MPGRTLFRDAGAPRHPFLRGSSQEERTGEHAAHVAEQVGGPPGLTAAWAARQACRDTGGPSEIWHDRGNALENTPPGLASRSAGRPASLLHGLPGRRAKTLEAHQRFGMRKGTHWRIRRPCRRAGRAARPHVLRSGLLRQVSARDTGGPPEIWHDRGGMHWRTRHPGWRAGRRAARPHCCMNCQAGVPKHWRPTRDLA